MFSSLDHFKQGKFFGLYIYEEMDLSIKIGGINYVITQ